MKFIEKSKEFIKKYRHAWVFLYAFIYMPWFMYLERHVTSHYYIIHSPLDDFIPFIEFFIIPYCLWFVFMAVSVLYFFFTDKTGFYRLISFLIIGMTLFLIVCTIFPNGLNLRPTVFARDNIFVDMVKKIYAADTPTNVLPSIHVFNTLGVLIAVSHSDKLKAHKLVRCSTYILGILIILSTIFLKQHSVTDVIAAFVMACAIYPIVYASQMRKATRFSHQPI
ncbi:MAG: phosphatase PAP2 family protein [Lachnospiraceae bacterium]